MRSHLLALIVLIAGCSAAPVKEAGNRRDLLADFQFIQGGKVVKPGNGVVRLNRNAFRIRYTGKGEQPSIFASSNPKVKEQFQSLRDPLVTSGGKGTAVPESELYVDGDALELYDGWASYEKRQKPGKYLDRYRAEFTAFRTQLSSEPLIIESGRNYSNFVLQSDGYRVYDISKINAKPFPEIDHTLLYFVLFVDDTRFSSDVSLYRLSLLQWAPLVVEFAGED